MSDVEPSLFNAISVADAYRQFLQPAMFDPWARALLEFVPPAPGDVVLDVASGTGAVAQAAAVIAGAAGRVIAADISPLMLAARPSTGGDERAPVEQLVGPAERLDLSDGSVDVAYCQQGLQFMPDRNAVMAEIRRVLRPGGAVGVAVWDEDSSLEPFATYARILQAHGVAEPYPQAYDMTTVTMSERSIEEVLVSAGLDGPVVRRVELPLVWPDPQAAAWGIMGSTYGPTVAAMSPAERKAVFAAILEETSNDHPARIMSAAFGRGSAP